MMEGQNNHSANNLDTSRFSFHSGTLLKKSTWLGKWRERFICIKDHSLLIAANVGATPHEELDLRTVDEVNFGSEFDLEKRYSMYLKSKQKQGRTYLFACQNSDELHRWVLAVKHAIRKHVRHQQTILNHDLVAQYRKLKEVPLSHDLIKDADGRVVNYIRLLLDFNEISSLPEKGKLKISYPTLIELSLASNLLGFGNSIGTFPSLPTTLQVLDLSSNGLGLSLLDDDQLDEGWCFYDPLLNCLKDLSVLQSLTLAENRISENILPNLSALTMLTTLKIADNCFHDVKKLFSRLPSSIRRLEIQMNTMTDNWDLCDIHNTLPNLTYLDVSECNLKHVPEPLLGLRGLSCLNLGTNLIQHLPLYFSNNWPHLKKLFLEYNLIETFPFDVLDIEGMAVLNLDGNPCWAWLPPLVRPLAVRIMTREDGSNPAPVYPIDDQEGRERMLRRHFLPSAVGGGSDWAGGQHGGRRSPVDNCGPPGPLEEQQGMMKSATVACKSLRRGKDFNCREGQGRGQGEGGGQALSVCKDDIVPTAIPASDSALPPLGLEQRESSHPQNCEDERHQQRREREQEVEEGQGPQGQTQIPGEQLGEEVISRYTSWKGVRESSFNASNDIDGRVSASTPSPIDRTKSKAEMSASGLIFDVTHVDASRDLGLTLKLYDGYVVVVAIDPGMFGPDDDDVSTSVNSMSLLGAEVGKDDQEHSRLDGVVDGMVQMADDIGIDDIPRGINKRIKEEDHVDTQTSSSLSTQNPQTPNLIRSTNRNPSSSSSPSPPLPSPPSGRHSVRHQSHSTDSRRNQSTLSMERERERRHHHSTESHSRSLSQSAPSASASASQRTMSSDTGIDESLPLVWEDPVHGVRVGDVLWSVGPLEPEWPVGGAVFSDLAQYIRCSARPLSMRFLRPVEGLDVGCSVLYQKKEWRVCRSIPFLRPGLRLSSHYPVPDLVVPGVFLGSWACARNVSALRELGVTHVLCVATFKPPFPSEFVYKCVALPDEDAAPLIDHFEACVCFVRQALDPAPAHIGPPKASAGEGHTFSALSSNKQLCFESSVGGGKGGSDVNEGVSESGVQSSGGGRGAVLVHCRAGVSRSAAVCAAYLMATLGMRASDALEHLKSVRPRVKVRDGFLSQLQQWEVMLATAPTVKEV